MERIPEEAVLVKGPSMSCAVSPERWARDTGKNRRGDLVRSGCALRPVQCLQVRAKLTVPLF